MSYAAAEVRATTHAILARLDSNPTTANEWEIIRLQLHQAERIAKKEAEHCRAEEDSK